MEDRVLGLDGYGKRWLGVTLVEGQFHAVCIFETIPAALAHEPDCAVVAIDIPIGLADGIGRPADREATLLVGDRRSSVFPTLPEAVYAEAIYRDALHVSRQLTGKGISKQSHALRAKILEAAAATAGDSRLVEVHPEVSFRSLGGAPLRFSKKAWNGIMERRNLLASVGIVVPDALPGDAGKAPPDDVLDAAVAAWSARRVAQGTALVLPALAPVRRGQVGVIWY